jgi:hypothetical protein
VSRRPLAPIVDGVALFGLAVTLLYLLARRRSRTPSVPPVIVPTETHDDLREHVLVSVNSEDVS